MNNILALIGFFILVAYAGLTLLYLSKIHSLFALLKAHEPDAYLALGEPHLFLNNTPKTNGRVLPFLLKGHFTDLSHEGVRDCARSVRTLLIAGIVMFPLGIACLFMGGVWRA